jgi:UDP-N-acetyl-D-glucosamine/UDP-N-acetyl-D-galactosamine dehydrogenase
MDLRRKIETKQAKIGVIGLGYVGLPLAAEFGKHFVVVGFDINAERVDELKSGVDKTLEVSPEELKAAKHLSYTCNAEELKDADVFIVSVPTPVDEYKRPDLTPLKKASETVGKVMKPGAIVVYESTVYPGCTEEDCVPILESSSGLKFNADFFGGYSPERINPGDRQHRLTNIKKIVSGSTPETAHIVNSLYSSIITAGTHLASSIKVAEAAKVIENSQRDINIAFVNELSKLFDLMGIDTLDVLEAAGTKWNFLPFRPGLVGGHCIGVDPYYLTHKAVQLGYNPEIILAGRRLNDSMGAYVANEFVKLLIKKKHVVYKAKILILGITFKENCPDVRNSRVIDIIQQLIAYGCEVDVHDPWADRDEVRKEYGIELLTGFAAESLRQYKGCIVAVAHTQFEQIPLCEYRQDGFVLYDVKGLLPKNSTDKRL